MIIGNCEEKFKSFVENIDIGIFSFNKQDYYKDINSKFCGIIGYDRHELHNYRFPEPFWPQNFYINVLNEMQSYKQSGLLKIDTYFRRKDGSFFPVQLRGCVIPETVSNESEYIIVVEDISEQKKAEREFKLSQEMLIALNNKLERLVQERTSQLQQVMKQKNEFINQLGHDLKNPLNPMINLMPVLNNKIKDNHCKEILSVLLRNVNYMQELIVQTIKLAKLDSPNVKLHFESINLKNEIESIIENNFTINLEKNISIQTDIQEQIWVEADKLRLNELIINIIENAIKYGKEHGNITITSEEIDTSNIVQIRITDDGIGMSPDQVSHVFDDFYKVNHHHSTFKSCGLGMSICKRIVEKHHGTITCESPGIEKGTSVLIRLPSKQNHFSTSTNNEQKLKQTVSLLNKI